jgi:hypothetical protein
VISSDITDVVSTGAFLTERHDVLHADNEHKSGTRVAWICLRSEMSSRNEADNETELL